MEKETNKEQFKILNICYMNMYQNIDTVEL